MKLGKRLRKKTLRDGTVTDGVRITLLILAKERLSLLLGSDHKVNQRRRLRMPRPQRRTREGNNSLEVGVRILHIVTEHMQPGRTRERE